MAPLTGEMCWMRKNRLNERRTGAHAGYLCVRPRCTCTMQQAEGSGGLLSMKSNKAHSVAVRFVLFFFLMVAVAWGAYFWWQYSIAPVDPSDKIRLTVG